MNIKLFHHGKSNSKPLLDLENEYLSRLKHYAQIEIIILPDAGTVSKTSIENIKKQEGEQLLKQLKTGDLLFLFDENGKQYSSVEFADFFQKKMNSGAKNLVLVTGGAYGFSEVVYKRANGQISISKMTFTHLMIRVLVAEQIYRAYSILRNEKYHHQ